MISSPESAIMQPPEGRDVLGEDDDACLLARRMRMRVKIGRDCTGEPTESMEMATAGASLRNQRPFQHLRGQARFSARRN